MSSFYEEGPEDMDAGIDDVVEVPVAAKQPAKKEVKAAGGTNNFATLSSLNDSSSEDEDDEKGQAFYAGGSQTSGQQILGPPRKKDPIKDYVQEAFRQAQSGNLEQFDPEDAPSGAAPASRSFSGTGYRLGQTDSDHVAVPSSSRVRKAEECDAVTIRVYRQGFTVDDGDLRPYEDPRNREFFESITHNEIPAELRKQGKTMVHVNVEDHLSEDYVKKAPKFKAFGGSGHTLGSPTPPMTGDAPTPTPAAGSNPAENEAKASAELNVQQDAPSTMLSIRLADGGRLSARFNLTHTVQNIHQYIVTARPEYTGRTFMLLTTFPNKELASLGDTIEQAGLQNAAILQRLK